MRKVLTGLLLLVNIFNFGGAAICGPDQQLTFLAVCQETCETEKPTLCLPGPHCICPDNKIWDEKAQKCVLPDDCSFKGEKKNALLPSMGTNYGTGLLNWAMGGAGQSKADGGVGASLSANGLFGMGGILSKFFSNSMEIPADLAQNIEKIAKNIVNFKIGVLAAKIQFLQEIIGNLKIGADTFMKVFSLDTEFISSITNKIQEMINLVINFYSSASLDVFKDFHKMTELVTGTMRGIKQSFSEISSEITTRFAKVFEKGLDSAQVKTLLSIPGIQHAVAMVNSIGEKVILSKSITVLKTVNGIIHEYESLFGPVRMVTSQIDAIINKMEKLKNGPAILSSDLIKQQ